MSVDRGRYGCVIDDESDPDPGAGSAADLGSGRGRLVTAMKARELGKGSIVVGDRVALAGDTSGSTGSLARIVRVEERTSVLRRSADDTDPLERVVVANADQMVIVCALADPEPKTRFIDRCLVAAYDAGLDPLLVLTKSDLAVAAPAPGVLPAAGHPDADHQAAAGRADAGPAAQGARRPAQRADRPVRRREVLPGQRAGAGRRAGRWATVNAVTGKGRHTSSSAIALPLPGDSGWLIDTPGVRGFGLGHVTPDRLIEAFGDLAEGTAACPPGCDHLSPDCALDEWAAAHDAKPRLDSLRRLLRSRESAD